MKPYQNLLAKIEPVLGGLYTLCREFRKMPVVIACAKKGYPNRDQHETDITMLHFGYPLAVITWHLENIDTNLFTLRNRLNSPRGATETNLFLTIEHSSHNCMAITLEHLASIPSTIKEITRVMRKFPAQLTNKDFGEYLGEMKDLQRHSQILYDLLIDIRQQEHQI